MLIKKKRDESDFQYLIRLKAKMKSFQVKEEVLRNQLHESSSKKIYKKIESQLDEHLNSFLELEDALVSEESKMINPDRGLYKGIGINVRDKSLKRIPMYLKYSNLNNHVGYTGTTRVGKTKNMISDVDQLINKGWDVIVFDPKGGEDQEILTEVIQSCMKAGRAEDFKYISPAFPIESEHVNLLYGMGDDEIASMIKTFAESISDDGFFTSVVYENTLAVLKAFTFIQAATDPNGKYTEKLEKEELEKYIKLKVLKDVNTESVIESQWDNTLNPNELALLSQKKTNNISGDGINSIPSVSLYLNRSMITFKILSNYTTFQAIDKLRETLKNKISLPPFESIGREKYIKIKLLKEEAISILDKVLSTDETNFSKISKTHSVLLSQLVYGDIGEVFSGTGINPIANRLLSDKKGLVCVMQSYPMRYKTVSNISVMAVLKSIESLMGLVGTSGRKGKRRLAICIDEAGAVMYKGIEDLFNKAGGLGVTMMVYTQSYEDYALTLGDTNANVIIDNVNTIIIMRMNHPASCKRAAEMIGSVRKHISMYMGSGDTGSRFSVGNEDEDVSLPEDIRTQLIGSGYMIHNGETFIVDFPYMKGLENYPINMPTLDNEKSRRYLSLLEEDLIDNLNTQDSFL